MLAGLGNIHVTEALFRARLSPLRLGSSLTRREVGALARATEASIRYALEEIARTTPPDRAMRYLQDAHAENPFLVYGRAGEPCVRCRGVVRVVVQGGRSSAYCPACQR